MKFYHRVRIFTAAPILASGLLIVLGLQRPEIFSGPAQWLLSLLFLGVLPLLGYPLQPYLPYFKAAGRPGQRTLAMLFAALGYRLPHAGLHRWHCGMLARVFGIPALRHRAASFE